MTAEEMLRRFDHLGGQVFHFHDCCASVMPDGVMRVSPWLLPELCASSERVTAKERTRANRLLLARAKKLPPRAAPMPTGEPHLYAYTTVFHGRDCWLLTIPRCPFCAATHYHGGGSLDGAPLLGSRVAHCVPSARPHMYCLTTDEALQGRLA